MAVKNLSQLPHTRASIVPQFPFSSSLPRATHRQEGYEAMMGRGETPPQSTLGTPICTPLAVGHQGWAQRVLEVTQLWKWLWHNWTPV